MNAREYLEILHIAEKLKDTPRHCTTSNGRVESVVLDKKRNFIKGFMADDATLVYKDRQNAADVLWKHVKHFM